MSRTGTWYISAIKASSISLKTGLYSEGPYDQTYLLLFLLPSLCWLLQVGFLLTCLPTHRYAQSWYAKEVGKGWDSVWHQPLNHTTMSTTEETAVSYREKLSLYYSGRRYTTPQVDQTSRELRVRPFCRRDVCPMTESLERTFVTDAGVSYGYRGLWGTDRHREVGCGSPRGGAGEGG